MARDENAVLAVRICGLAFAAVQVNFIMWHAGGWWPWRYAVPAFDLLYQTHYLVAFAAGIGVFLLAPRLSRLAAPPGDAADVLWGPLRLGVLVIGLYCALLVVLNLARLSLLAFYGQIAAVPWATATAAVVLLGWPLPVVGFLRRRAEAGQNSPGARLVIGAGLGLLGVWLLVLIASSFIYDGWALIFDSSGGPRSLGMRHVFEDLLRMAMSAAMIWWSGHIARRLSPEALEPSTPAAAIGPAMCLCAGAFLVGFYLVVLRLADLGLITLPHRIQVISPTVSYVIWLALTAGLVVAAAWGFRGIGRRIGRRMYPEKAARQGAMARVVVDVQVGLLLTALKWLVAAVDLTTPHPSGATLRALIVGLLLFACWAEVGRWLVGPAEGDPKDLSAERATVLRPWLVLLGFYVSLAPLARTLTWGVDAIGVLPPMVWPTYGPGPYVWPLPSPTWLVGLLLILAAGPLSRWLAFDSLFGRWRGMGRWRERTDNGSAT